MKVGILVLLLHLFTLAVVIIVMSFQSTLAVVGNELLQSGSWSFINPNPNNGIIKVQYPFYFTNILTISIVPGASSLGYQAFSPNPAYLIVGDIVQWINDDTSFHTVTSGSGPNDPYKGQSFDSGLSGSNALTTKGKIFSVRFMSPGQYFYFCELHPTMIGELVVLPQQQLQPPFFELPSPTEPSSYPGSQVILQYNNCGNMNVNCNNTASQVQGHGNTVNMTANK
jgi:plastocyanin